MSFDAYYYSFDPTGNAEIDAILEAVADAGKGCHHTEDWREYGLDTAIQEAANKAALALAPSMQPAPATERASTGKQDKFLAYWTSIETDTRKALILGARTDTEKLHDLLRTVYEAATQAERVQQLQEQLDLANEHLRQAVENIAKMKAAERVQSSESIASTDLFDLIAEWATKPEGTRHSTARAIIELIDAWGARRATASKAEAPFQDCPVCEQGKLIPLRTHYCNACGIEVGTTDDITENKRAMLAYEAASKAESAPRVEQEAARYRWLRDKSEPGICAFYLSVGQAFKDVKFIPETVDAAIDAQILAAATTKQGTP